jgi:predicted metal-binding protein
LDAHVKKVKEKHPKRSEQRIRNSFYMKNDYEEIYGKISRFLDTYKEPFEEHLIIWPAKCNICDNKEDGGCTYDSGEPCRYPQKLRHTMTGVGINTNETVSKLNIDLEWPPVRYAYRFSLVCFR